MRIKPDGVVLTFEQGDISWMDRALCLGMDQSIFFPGKGNSSKPAKKICEQCPVQEDCLEYSLQSPYSFAGIWGGHTVQERERILRARKAKRRIEEVK